jgi:hypothetical protein
MDLLAIVVLIVLGISVAVQCANTLPGLALVLWPASVRSTFDSRDPGETLHNAPQALRDRLEELKTLDFSIIGVKIEQPPLWGRAVREIALVSKAKQCYASIILHPNASPASVYCYTPFSDGGMVFTRDFEAGSEAEGERLSVKNVVSTGLSGLVEDHVRRVEGMMQRGLMPRVGSTQHSRLEATGAFYASDYARRAQRDLWWPRIARLAIAIGLFLAVTIFVVIRISMP